MDIDERIFNLHGDVSSSKAKIEDFCERLDRVEGKIDHLDVCIDELKNSMSFWRGRMTALASLAAAGISIAVNKLWP